MVLMELDNSFIANLGRIAIGPCLSIQSVDHMRTTIPEISMPTGLPKKLELVEKRLSRLSNVHSTSLASYESAQPGSQLPLSAFGGYCFPSISTLGSQVHRSLSGNGVHDRRDVTPAAPPGALVCRARLDE